MFLRTGGPRDPRKIRGLDFFERVVQELFFQRPSLHYLHNAGHGCAEFRFKDPTSIMAVNKAARSSSTLHYTSVCGMSGQLQNKGSNNCSSVLGANVIL